MKVCFIVGTLGRGGAERQLVYMLRALQNAGIQLRVLCLTKGEANEKEIERLGIEVEWIGSSGNRLVRLLKIIANVRKRPVDVLQSSHFFTNIYAGATGRILGIPNIGAIRSDLAYEFITNKFYGDWQLRLPAHLISNSSIARERAVSRGIRQGKIDILKNVVDTNSCGTECSRRGRKSMNILFAGRLSKEKQPELFIDLAFRLQRDLSHLALRFEMAGDGPLRAELERRAKNHRLPIEQFSFLGEHAEMANLYRRTDILVLTSLYEGTPNVILEAMAQGIPVVATRVGGVPDILSKDCGILVDPSDFDGLCWATTQLIRDPDLRYRLGRNGRQYVIANHSLPYLTERLTEIYSKMLGDDQIHG